MASQRQSSPGGFGCVFSNNNRPGLGVDIKKEKNPWKKRAPLRPEFLRRRGVTSLTELIENLALRKGSFPLKMRFGNGLVREGVHEYLAACTDPL